MIISWLLNAVLSRLIEHGARKSLARAGKAAAQQARPSCSADLAAWASYWKMVGQPWRSAPEIGRMRQQYLAEQLAIVPDVAQGIYPMKNIKLSRADIEWLLATHDNGRGPIDAHDRIQRERKGLDLRGADLRYSDLSGLPLTQLRGGLNFEERTRFPAQNVQEMAGVQLEGATLSSAHLERADLYKAHLAGANLYRAFLEETYLKEAHLEGAILSRAHLEGS